MGAEPKAATDYDTPRDFSWGAAALLIFFDFIIGAPLVAADGIARDLISFMAAIPPPLPLAPPLGMALPIIIIGIALDVGILHLALESYE